MLDFYVLIQRPLRPIGFITPWVIASEIPVDLEFGPSVSFLLVLVVGRVVVGGVLEVEGLVAVVGGGLREDFPSFFLVFGSFLGGLEAGSFFLEVFHSSGEDHDGVVKTGVFFVVLSVFFV
jgi:hypothetical protein